jgi:hypothetical protein
MAGQGFVVFDKVSYRIGRCWEHNDIFYVKIGLVDGGSKGKGASTWTVPVMPNHEDCRIATVPMPKTWNVNEVFND